MRILLINQAFVSPDEPGHTRHFELAQYLKQHGHELVIVGSDINYQTGERIIRHNGLSVEQSLEGVRVIRTAILPSLHRSFFWRILSFISFMFSSLLVSLRVKDVDLVMGTTPPIFQAFTIWVIAFLRRKPFLLEVRDLWPEFGISMGVFEKSGGDPTFPLAGGVSVCQSEQDPGQFPGICGLPEDKESASR